MDVQSSLHNDASDKLNGVLSKTKDEGFHIKNVSFVEKADVWRKVQIKETNHDGRKLKSFG